MSPPRPLVALPTHEVVDMPPISAARISGEARRRCGTAARAKAEAGMRGRAPGTGATLH